MREFEELKRKLIILIEENEDEECILFLQGCIAEFIECREELGVK